MDRTYTAQRGKQAALLMIESSDIAAHSMGDMQSAVDRLKCEYTQAEITYALNLLTSAFNTTLYMVGSEPDGLTLANAECLLAGHRFNKESRHAR